jgi:uncharacterized protein (TIGR02145 family)
MNSNFALFIKNNGTESINVSISWADTSGKKIYLSGMNESNADSSTWVITNLVNHVIISGENYIWRHNLASVHGRTISWYGKCDTWGKILSPKSIYGKGTEDECSDTDIIVCTWDNTWYTMSSCNVWATLAWTWSDSYWNFFQWGNNYRFPNTWAVSTSTWLINTTDYWPENPYSSDTFITLYGGWSLSQNDNLWWWEWDMATLNWPWTDEGRQWACPVWYHIPSTLDWKLLVSNWFESKWETCNPSVWDSCSWYWNTSLLHFQSDLKIPLAGFLTYSDGSLKSPGDIGYYWSSSPIDTSFVHTLYLLPSYVFPQFKNGYSVAFSVRCFRNTSKFFNN